MKYVGLEKMFRYYCKLKGWKLSPASNSRFRRMFTDVEYITHFIEYKDELFAVKILDWRRSIGIDQIIRLHRFCEVNGLRGILVGNIISSNTLDFAVRHGISYLNRDELEGIIELY